MLLIGDIHINAKHKDGILSLMRAFIQEHPQEKNLVFLGDFVYHFSYDRTSLLALFDFFLECFNQGKSLYLLAGNHDWIGESFVFEEAKKLLSVFQQQEGRGKLRFITEACIEQIEGEPVLFLPFSLKIDAENYPGLEDIHSPLIDELLASENKHEVFSGKLNQLLDYFVQKHQGEKPLKVIHHYYTNKEVFPGYRSFFSFKDIALSESWLDHPKLVLISGHLHAPFVHKNYLCTGSIWATSPLEVDQIKGFWTLNGQDLGFYGATLLQYMRWEQSELTLEKEDIERKYHNLTEWLRKNLQASSFFTLEKFEVASLDFKKLILEMLVDKIDYEQTESLVSPELMQELSDFRLKKNSAKVSDLLEKLERPKQDELMRFWWWKELLKNFLLQQYPEDHQEYEELLRELKIL